MSFDFMFYVLFDFYKIDREDKKERFVYSVWYCFHKYLSICMFLLDYVVEKTVIESNFIFM